MSNTATQEQARTDEQPPVETADQQLVPTTRADTGLSRTGAMGFGLVPRNFDEAWRMATIFAKSALVPKQYQGKPEDILIAMQYGAEIGLPPMASLQSVAVINGKPGVYGDGFLGVIMSKPAYAKHLEYYELADGTHVKHLRTQDYESDDTKAVSLFWRKGNPDPFTGTFSIGDAKRARLWGKEGPWTNYPARQLKWRARGFGGRDGFSAELRGVKMAEELLDTPEDEIAGETTYNAPIAEPVRRSEKIAGTGTTAAAAPADEPALKNGQPAESTGAPANAPAQPAAASSARQPGDRIAAAATPAKANGPAPKKSTFPQTSPSVTTKGVVITNTALREVKGVAPFYEIRGEVAGGATFIWFTDDEGLYRAAATCEGSESKFSVTWHRSKKYDGSACKVITAIEAAN